MSTKHEPGTGPLTFVVQSDKPKAHACGDCRHVVERGSPFEKCGALGARYTNELRGKMLAKGEWYCTAFSARKPQASLVARSRRGWLYRLLAWIWVLG